MLDFRSTAVRYFKKTQFSKLLLVLLICRWLCNKHKNYIYLIKLKYERFFSSIVPIKLNLFLRDTKQASNL